MRIALSSYLPPPPQGVCFSSRRPPFAQRRLPRRRRVEAVVVAGTRAEGAFASRHPRARRCDRQQVAGAPGPGRARTRPGALQPGAGPRLPPPAIADGSDHVRPPRCAVLAEPTLVLINGQRGHVSAGRQRQRRHRPRFDLSTSTPSRRPLWAPSKCCAAAPSAQYGADAIAGVINLRLREARSGGSVTANWGIYNTEVTPPAAPSARPMTASPEACRGLGRSAALGGGRLPDPLGRSRAFRRA